MGNYGKVLFNILKDKYDIYQRQTHNERNEYHYVVITFPIHVEHDLTQYKAKIFINMSTQGYCLHKYLPIIQTHVPFIFCSFGAYHIRNGQILHKYAIIDIAIFNKMCDLTIFNDLNINVNIIHNVPSLIFSNHNQLLHSSILAFGNHENTNLYDISNKLEVAYYLSKVANEIADLHKDVNYSVLELFFSKSYIFCLGFLSNYSMSLHKIDFDNSTVATSRFFYEDILSLVYIKKYADENKIDVPYINLLLQKFSVKYNITLEENDKIIRKYKNINKCINKLQKLII